MDAAPPEASSKVRALSKQLAGALAVGIVVGAACGYGGWYLWVKPQRELAVLRYEAGLDVMKLYALETAYQKAHGSYASGLDALLASSPDGAALKAHLASRVDLNTVAVAGDAAKFKIEVNVLDADRTLMKVLGPTPDFHWLQGTSAPTARTETVGGAMPDAGAPVLPNGR